jgi:hypothetical protein
MSNGAGVLPRNSPAMTALAPPVRSAVMTTVVQAHAP